MNNHCSSSSEETSLSDVPLLLAEEEGEEGLDIFALERAPPKTSFCDGAISIAFALVSMARVAVLWQMVDESISMERLAVLADSRCRKKCEMREHGNSSAAVFEIARIDSPYHSQNRQLCQWGIIDGMGASAREKKKKRETIQLVDCCVLFDRAVWVIRYGLTALSEDRAIG